MVTVEGDELSTAIDETRFGGFHGDCFRCGEYGHWSESADCPWTVKATTAGEHESRIDSLIERWQQFVITRSQKRKYIAAENELWRKT